MDGPVEGAKRKPRAGRTARGHTRKGYRMTVPTDTTSVADQLPPPTARQSRVYYHGWRFSDHEILHRQREWQEGQPWPAELEVRVGQLPGMTGPLTHVELHSPGGFEWGYAGSGPHDLALSILCDFLEESPAEVQASGQRTFAKPTRAFVLHDQFAHTVVARWDRDHWRIEGREITEWLRTSLRAQQALHEYARSLEHWEEWQALLAQEAAEEHQWQELHDDR